MLRFEVNAELLDERFRRLSSKVRERVAVRALGREMRKTLRIVKGLYAPYRTILPRLHLKDAFFVKVKRYKGAVWAGVGVREGRNPKGNATNRWHYSEMFPGWRFGFIERDRRIRGGPGAGRGGKRLRQGAIPLYVEKGKRHLDRAQAMANMDVPVALRRELSKVVTDG